MHLLPFNVEAALLQHHAENNTASQLGFA